MAEDGNRSPADELYLVAKRRFRRAEVDNYDILKSLGWLGAKPQESEQRVEDFEFVNQRLNEIMKNPSDLASQYRDVQSLAADLKGQAIPTLAETRQLFYHSDDVAKLVQDTIENAAQNYAVWAKINPDYPSSGTPASGALIEGFGAFLGSFATPSTENTSNVVEQVSRHYVLAFEAVLLAERPNSPLVADVIGWMQEEIDSFPPVIHSLITQASRQASR